MKRMVSGINYRYIGDETPYILPIAPGSCVAEVTAKDDGDGRVRTLTMSGRLRYIPRCSSGLVRLQVYYDDGSMDWFGTESEPVTLELKSAEGRSFSIKYTF